MSRGSRGVAGQGGCCCFIIPTDVLKRFSHDKKLSAEERQAFGEMVRYEKLWRDFRVDRTEHLRAVQAILPSALTAAAAGPPAFSVFDCRNGTKLPGVLVKKPATSTDASAKRAYTQTAAVARFFDQVFGRNSIDNGGMPLNSSIHYSVKYNNAFWNGSQMTYGDGDGQIFVDFTQSNDVIAHELMHGVTQYTLGLDYANQPGGLNESLSDVFGSMFRQWQAKQTVDKADWLVGKEIMGPAALARRYTCLRDLSKPAGKHCLAPQVTNFSQYRDGLGPHTSSGIANLAFYHAAMAIGGKSWEKAGRVWYGVLTGSGVKPKMTMKQFATQTRKVAGTLFPNEPAVKTAVDAGWKAVGL
jgi:Zn-dependent metalloprotease